jgi:hypothetical protein
MYAMCRNLIIAYEGLPETFRDGKNSLCLPIATSMVEINFSQFIDGEIVRLSAFTPGGF